MKDSTRHHYVPVFLSKNFAKENGKLIGYNKLENRVFQVSPSNVFLINDRNTFINQHGEEDDVIEKIYAQLDSQFSKVLNEVKRTERLDSENLKMLLFLAYLSKWRVPQYDESFINAKNYFSVDDLGLGIKVGDLKLDIDLESVFETELHQELKRFLLAIQPFRFNDDFKTIAQNTFLISSPFPSLIGDCPVNEIPVNSDIIFEDFVFPITKELTLIHTQRIDKFGFKDFLENGKIDNVNRFIKEFSIARDLSTLSLTNQNVGCADEEYLNQIIQSYKICMGKDNIKETLSSSVFTILYNYQDYK